MAMVNILSITTVKRNIAFTGFGVPSGRLWAGKWIYGRYIQSKFGAFVFL